MHFTLKSSSKTAVLCAEIQELNHFLLYAFYQGVVDNININTRIHYILYFEVT